MLGLYPRSRAQDFANNACVLKKSGSGKKGRMEIKRNRKNVEGEENGALPKGEREGRDSFSATLHGGDGFAHLRLFNVRKFIFSV